jgi:TolB protein
MKTHLAYLLLLTANVFAQRPDKLESRLEILDTKTGKRQVIFQKNQHFEAPNWSKDGKFLIINSLGKLYRILATGSEWQEINTGFAQNCNNDHGIMPDGQTLVISHYDEKPNQANPQDYHTSVIYTLPVSGGKPERVTPLSPSFWHGVSPDGKTLLYCGERNTEFDIYAISATGGTEKRLTDSPGLDDGPEFSANGKLIFFNSYRTGTMQIWQMNADGSNPKALTGDAYSNWFPHPSPDGKKLVFLTYLQDQQSQHPFGKNVRIRLLTLKDGKIKDLTETFYGGQGSLNVPSWSPDSHRIAFVSYRKID